MRDPFEGVTPEGLIRTGVDRSRIADEFGPVLDAAVDLVRTQSAAASVYVYGSVATGQARSPTSDVDLLVLDVGSDAAGRLGTELSERFGEVCRGVEIAVASTDDLAGPGDEAYGFQVFLHHYCVHLIGPEPARPVAGFPADRRAARGFNGDIAQHERRWRASLGDDAPDVLGRRLARKTLLAVGGLVSVHDHTWTTDRARAAHRWSEVVPDLGPGLEDLLSWSEDPTDLVRADVANALSYTVAPIVRSFADNIGLWDENT